jgi:asparagine synthase (glutamine-hydrolysing)
MCGIAGQINLSHNAEISMELLEDMIAALRHRGPDGFGFYRDKKIGLAHARLSIIDLESGAQPMHNEDKSLWIVFNGEIFNYLELRDILDKRGHRFYTKSDTEVILHLYEDYGSDCLKFLNGQFAFAIWNKKEEELFIARDRVGIRPFFYTKINGSLLFASEIKSLFVDKNVKREIDPFALDQIFTFWMTLPPRTSFRNILELPAGHHMTVKNGNVRIEKYWDPDFTPAGNVCTEKRYAEELQELLISATRLQLRADVPVGAYLSGGLDSSVIAALIKHFTDTPLRTFSVTFDDGAFDESSYQDEMIARLETDHSKIRCGYSDIGEVFPDVIWHTEKPVVRTAPAPLFLLSKLVRDSGYKVVLTGEGSDEILAGYDIFKEVKVRRFLEKQPDSRFRPLILKRLYPYLANSPVKSVPYAEAFFRSDSLMYPPEYYSHIPRWNTTSKIKTFFSDRLKESLDDYRAAAELAPLLSDVGEYDDISLAQYIEMKTLLSGYLLSSQGDRVAMAHSIEGRFPFLDHRVMEFCCKLPPTIRMRVLTEKYILKESMKELIPRSILERPKQPYRAPDSQSFFRGNPPDYVEEILSDDNLKKTGYFNTKSVAALAKKCRNNPILGFKDNMAAVGIISTLLLHDQFIANFAAVKGFTAKDKMEGRYYVANA